MFTSLAESVFFFYLKKIVKIVFIFSVLIFLFLCFYKSPLPPESQVIKEIKDGEPIQSELPANQKGKEIITWKGKYEYRLMPLYNYELNGLIVTEYKSENWLDVRHENDPGNIKDIYIVWGENISNGLYKEVKFSSGEFTCFYHWDKPLNAKFSGALLSNNHLVPKNADIADKIRESKIGDQVKVRGILADYSVYVDGKEIFTRKQSTKRDDVRNGACEIIYVTDFEIVKENILNFRDIKKVFGLSGLSSGILGLLFFLFR